MHFPDFGHTASQVPRVPTYCEKWDSIIEDTAQLVDDPQALLGMMRIGCYHR
jgi:hypothetical protein